MQQISYHCFISYTTREEEVRAIQPFVDVFLRVLLDHDLLVAPFFYDHLTLENRQYPPSELREELLKGVNASVCMVSFVSEGYLSSPWCLFEWGTMDGIQLHRGPEFSAILPIVWKQLRDSGFEKTRPYLDLVRNRNGYVGGRHEQDVFHMFDLEECAQRTIHFVGQKFEELKKNKGLYFNPAMKEQISRRGIKRREEYERLLKPSA